MFLKLFSKMRKIGLVILLLVILSATCLIFPLPSQAAVKFNGFDAYGGSVNRVYSILGTTWMEYTHLEYNGVSISASKKLLNIDAALLMGPCTSGSSLLGFGKGKVAILLWCDSMGIVM